ncbi:hypothetical protein VTO42DRAFT_2135 [Malbranchea cinnamomea]
MRLICGIHVLPSPAQIRRIVVITRLFASHSTVKSGSEKMGQQPPACDKRRITRRSLRSCDLDDGDHKGLAELFQCCDAGVFYFSLKAGMPIMIIFTSLVFDKARRNLSLTFSPSFSRRVTTSAISPNKPSQSCGSASPTAAAEFLSYYILRRYILVLLGPPIYPGCFWDICQRSPQRESSPQP